MLEGTLITLGPIVPIDFPFLFAWADDAETAHLNEPYRPPVWKSQEDYWNNLGNDASKVYFAIRIKQSAPIVGYVQLWSIDAVSRSAILGIRIGHKNHRGLGYGGDALRLTIDYCWNQLNLSRIALMVFETNERAMKLYSDHGFKKEGRLEKAVFIDGRWIDVVLMALLHPSRQNA